MRNPAVRHLPLLIAAVLSPLLASCSDSPSGADVPLTMATKLELLRRTDTLRISDSMTVKLAVLNRLGDRLFDELPRWSVSDSSVLWPIASSRTPAGTQIVLGAADSGSAWVKVSANGLRDSVRIRVNRAPVRVSGFTFDSRGYPNRPSESRNYQPADGICYTFTIESIRRDHGLESNYLWLAGFVVDGHRNIMFRRSTTWSVSNPGILELTPADSANELLVRPLAQGHTELRIRDGEFTGVIYVWVDTVNMCRGIVPGLGLADSSGAHASALKDGRLPHEVNYVW
ncbi:MAG: hypothetical protein H0X64_01015 [Gemmatimonadaceae bacterium]|nr:hypothetical protein [Gemmatimonadaceae bacterium]